MLYSIISMLFCYGVVVGFGIRIFLYYKTNDPKYKEDPFLLFDRYHGEHEEK